MSLDVDTLLDRRRLARRVSFWRGLVILIVIAAIGAGIYWTVDLRPTHIARIPVQGAIVSSRPLIKMIESMKENDRIAGVLISIDSPGGTSVGGERLYEALRALNAEKPVVAHINTIGASAAYMTALASDHIVAHRSSLTGSIGVLIQYGQINQLLKNWGIEVSKVDSGPLKAEPNPFQPAQPDAVAALQSVVDDTFAWFLSLVEERRAMPEAKARRLADGRIFTGHQALEEGLIDEIGGEDVAIAWLVSDRDIPADLPVKTYEPRDENDFSLSTHMADYVIGRIFGALGMEMPTIRPTISVDGLWSIWHGSAPSDAKVANND
ncbi:signal peptide peptidase SppA [Acuticoccus sp. M5D2P5]|uniref:signal peptide peptidase SppA n=1 Tax=Acuticoccus kalidii TaxID=2910977 RepID=UPI001F19ECC3|nr:signal peptide peptidase SppA [Acuticoccus kalidii]MCF3935990.1 signal peptide peptidase SppA [Acuticoccus kalidii]